MYRTAVITDEISQDLETAAKMAVSFGLQGLEIRSVEGKNPFEMDKALVRKICKVADAYNLSICAVAAPLFKCDIEDTATYKAHLEGAERCIEAAYVWNARILRGFTFWNRNNGETDFKRIVELYHPVIEMAERAGICIALESEPSVITCNMELLDHFLQFLNHPCVGALFDPGNEVCSFSNDSPYPVGYERLKGKIFHIHVKDMKRGFVPAMLGQGDVDFKGLFQRLKTDGYSGYVSVETHYRLSGQQLNDALLVKPQGGAFSEGGYEATEAYLKQLGDVYKWMEGDA